MLDTIRALFDKALKSNEFLKLAVVTGCLKIAKESIFTGGTIRKTVTENLTYDMLHSSAENLWSLLYLTGYLTQSPDTQDPLAEPGELALTIPNEEIRRLFCSTVAAWFKDTIKATDRTVLFSALWNRDTEACSAILSDLLFDTISYHDYKEDFYHAFLAGVLSFSRYKVESNRKQGEGRPDLVLKDARRGRAAVIEIKHAKAFDQMETACQEALGQIEHRRYVEGLDAECGEILCYGICFYNKRCLAKGQKYH